MNYKVFAIPTKVADLVRSTGKSPGYGHPAFTETATGYGPCRHCLQFFRVGEERRTLFTYDPFHGVAEPLPGPVFIHADACPRYQSDAFPAHLSEHPLTLVAYNDQRRIVEEVRLAPAHDAHAAVQQLLRLPDVQYIHVRDTEAGCYDCRIER